MTAVVVPAGDGAGAAPAADDVIDRVAARRARNLGIVSALVGVAAIALFSRTVGDATFVINERGATSLPDIVVPGALTATLLGLVAVALGVLCATRVLRWQPVVVLGLSLVLFLFAMLVWATAEATTVASTTLVGLFSGMLRRAAPLALGALAGLLCERSGVVNIAIEGMLLSGAFTGAVVASATDNLYAGVLAGIVTGALLGGVLALLSIRFVVDQIVGGTVINIFALGVTSYLSSQVLTEYQDLNDPGTFAAFAVPGLSNIPVLGPVLFDNPFHVYALFVLVAGIAFALYRTRWGLRVRAVGEHPSAADTVGIDVLRLRYVAVLLGGAVAGFGGTFFSLGSAGRFEENMTAGRGFIALAALIFGRWHPVGVLCAALVFGFAEEYAGRLGALGSPIPSEFLLMAPYVVTLVVVAGLIGRSRPPAADGQPFTR